MSVDIPRGTLVRSRVGVAGALEAALERQLTGYARIEPDSLGAEGEPGVLTFEDGIPVTAYCERGDSHGTKRGDSHGTKRGDSHGTKRGGSERADSHETDSGVDVDESRSDSAGSQNALRSGEALAALAGPGPCSVELYELPAGALEQVHEAPEFTVPPGAPAEELAGKQALAERTRERAPDDAPEQAGAGALESFLQDEDRIAAIQEEARAEAEKRAEEWGLDGELAGE